MPNFQMFFLFHSLDTHFFREHKISPTVSGSNMSCIFFWMLRMEYKKQEHVGKSWHVFYLDPTGKGSARMIFIGDVEMGDSSMVASCKLKTEIWVLVQ